MHSPVEANWVVTTLAGLAGYGGSANATNRDARFNSPTAVAVDIAGNLYVADLYFNTIRKGYPPPRFLNPAVLLGQFGADLTGPPGHSVVVDASTDLLNWLPIWTNTFGAGALIFTDPQSRSFDHPPRSPHPNGAQGTARPTLVRPPAGAVPAKPPPAHSP